MSTNIVSYVFFLPEDCDGPWLGGHSTRTGSNSSKAEKLQSSEQQGTLSPPQELRCASQDENELPLRSKSKSIKLKNNGKTENSKKLLKQASKDSVVLTGFKHLEPAGKSKEIGPQGDSHEDLSSDWASGSKCLAVPVWSNKTHVSPPHRVKHPALLPFSGDVAGTGHTRSLELKPETWESRRLPCLSDSGVESEPSSATKQAPESRTGSALLEVNPEWLPCALKPSLEGRTQSSLTSINSLPSDEDAEALGRRCTAIVQEQMLVFSEQAHGDAGHKNDPELHRDDSSAGLSLFEALSEGADICRGPFSKFSQVSSLFEGESMPGDTANLGADPLRPDESEYSPARDTRCKKAEDESHEMIENGYHEDTDGDVFINGLTQETQAGEDPRSNLERLGGPYCPSTGLRTQRQEQEGFQHWYNIAPPEQMRA